jgi:hypothetical protein
MKPGESVLTARSILFSRWAFCGVTMGVLLQGCAQPVAPPPAPPPPLPLHAGPPPAKLCSVMPFTSKEGATTDVQMVVSNEGGYCSASVTTDGGLPYDAPLVTVTPFHGIPRVVKYNGKTSVEYTPQPGFVGHDSYIVKLIVRGKPGFTTLNVSVTVK